MTVRARRNTRRQNVYTVRRDSGTRSRLCRPSPFAWLCRVDGKHATFLRTGQKPKCKNSKILFFFIVFFNLQRPENETVVRTRRRNRFRRRGTVSSRATREQYRTDVVFATRNRSGRAPVVRL